MTVSGLRRSLLSLSPVGQTSRIVDVLGEDPLFVALAAAADSELLQRDAADQTALSEGIAYAQRQGLLPVGATEREWTPLTVDRLTPAEVSALIFGRLQGPKSPPRLVAIAGPSGIGKGTVVAQLARDHPNLSTWSNGDAFRFITYLHLRSLGDDSSGQDAFIEKSILHIARSVHFDAADGLVGESGGATVRLRDVGEAHLRSAAVSRSVPSVSRFTQGHVIALTNAAASALPARQGLLVEGRRLTLNYLDADLRVELSVANRAELGPRRVAQRIVALLSSEPEDSTETVESLVRRAYR